MNYLKAWSTVASDADGSVLVATINPGRLYVSTDSGATWTERQPAGASDKYWKTVTVSDDGSKILAAVGGSSAGRIYLSSNSGVNWSEIQPAGASDKKWNSVAVSGSGDKMIVANGGDFFTCMGGPCRLFISSNGGTNWAETQPAGASNFYWNAVAVSDDGLYILAAISNGRSNFAAATASLQVL